MKLSILEKIKLSRYRFGEVQNRLNSSCYPRLPPHFDGSRLCCIMGQPRQRGWEGLPGLAS